jgi:hypothetical protein
LWSFASSLLGQSLDKCLFPDYNQSLTAINTATISIVK